MSVPQKEAWFNLAVIAVSLGLVLGLTPVLHQGALGGFGVLGLLGFAPLLYRRKPGQILTDERDADIRRRSVVIGYTVFWLAFVAAGTAAPFVYGECVPGLAVSAAVFGGVALFLGTMSVATLVQYARGAGDER